jgi:hypothetical protein
MKRYLFILPALCLTCNASDSLLTTWSLTNSGKYARVYETTAAKTSGTASTTWSGQTLPAYADIQEVSYSANWAYVKYTGLASHVMGPWLTPTGQVFQFWPANQSGTMRFPRTPAVQAGTKDTTALGPCGLFVNGVAMFNTLDAQAWTGTAIAMQGPHTQSTYYWHRNAAVAEFFNFDPAYGHQPPTGIYHTHLQPIALRYQLGDHVDYNSTTKTYTESATAITKHSPIVGWAVDGYPVYGPYGYSTSTNASSGLRRMVSGYVKRDGTNGTDSVANNRSTIPAWYARFRQAKFGGTYTTTATASRATVNTTYPLGTFAEDFSYLGDLGKVQGSDFDLDVYNGRNCVTPEFPNGTYAYFVTIDATGDGIYPYTLGYEYYGDATGGSVTSISETVATHAIGGPNAAPKLEIPSLTSSKVTLIWSAIEGGTYQVEVSTDLSIWTPLSTSVSPIQNAADFTTPKGIFDRRYFRVKRTGLATYDP